MNSEDLRSKSVDELVKEVLDLRKEQFNARFQKSQGSLENTAQVRVNRRNIARAKTILNEKRREEAKATSGKKAA
ncbi:MAG: 50S ribosomal protein L29 [Zetaproteobacteria bacterium]|nr:MAG: 50S ribosomal protein L29 [Zetaproteobacteria bacterium]